MAEIEVDVMSLDSKAEKLEVKAKSEDAAQQLAGEVVLSTYTENYGKDRVHAFDRHFWAGRALTNFPDLPSWTYAIPRQQGTQPEGVKWGIAYANGNDSTAQKWVVAFDTAAGKAYAEAGPIGEIDWNVIEVKLGMSGSKSEYVDPALGGKTIAEIDGLTAHARFYTKN